MKDFFKKFVYNSFSTRAAGFYLIAFAVAIGYATFIENDYGTSAAQKLVYKATWFELLLVLFSITLIVNVVRYRMVQQKKWALLIFHLAMVVIIIGAAITRYISFEGMMHIRQGGLSNIISSSDSYLHLNANVDGQNYEVYEPILVSAKGGNHFERSYKMGNHQVELRLVEVMPNPVQVLQDDPKGKPTLKVVFGGANGRSEYYLQEGEQKEYGGVLFNFTKDTVPNALNIYHIDNELFTWSNVPFEQRIMATNTQQSLAADTLHKLELRSLYSSELGQFVFGEYRESASMIRQSAKQKIESSSTVALKLAVDFDGETTENWIEGTAGYVGEPVGFNPKNTLTVAYGAKQIELPFSLYLHQFEMERYPGTNSPASYASEVKLLDPRNNTDMDYRIYMNHILDYDGYRFFQTSYDPDEKGTYLSVNHDFWGTTVTYIGYALLTLGMVLIFFTKQTRFYQLAQSLKKMRNKQTTTVLAVLLSAISIQLTAQHTEANIPASTPVSAEHADKFSKLTIQDHRGRMKPAHTLNRELLRKINGHESIEGLTADQVILSMYTMPEVWYANPIIKIGKSEEIGKLLGVDGKYASYFNFFNEQGQYLLQEEVMRANSKAPKDRGVFENQLIKLDERVNIVDMVFSGRLLRIFPLENDPKNTWAADESSIHNHEDNEVAAVFFKAYRASLYNGMTSGDFTDADKLLDYLVDYQHKTSVDILPSASKINAEIFLNNANIFNRLAAYYPLLGILYLFFLFVSVFKPNFKLKRIYQILTTLVLIGFVFQTLGLGLRWYVSGRAPWSNGYESMIYIAWTSALAGLLFARKSLGGMAATMVLSGTVLLISMLSFLDPEITPLVPVLRSYWLTIHVSLEAGSYGFLMLGAIIGLINLLLMVIISNENKSRVVRIVKEMTQMSEMTLIGGIVMLSVGTYLGGVWANESWGRYWGWDAKETWALVSILVYAFILHMRLIPGLGGLYQFNVATLFGLSSVIMTYYGVNYYLSGLHSYAAGDPVPIPNWVYISVVSLILTSIIAYFRQKKVLKA